MPKSDPEKIRGSYIKKAQAILRLTPDKQEKAKKKLNQRFDEKKSHLEKLDKEIALYKSRDEKGLIAYTNSLQKKASSEKISDFRLPITRSKYLKNKAKYDAIPWEDRPPVLPKGKTIKQWWDEQVKALEEKQAYEQADHDNLFEDNKTLLELEIDDLDSQKEIIEPLKFENMVQHFGGRFYHKLEDNEEKDIDKQVKSEKAGIKQKVEKDLESTVMKKEIRDREINQRVREKIDQRHRELRNAKLTDKNKVRFTEIRENELHRLNYGLDELQANYKKLTGKKYVPKKTD